MTAEVAVMNRQGVALAADSAVTISASKTLVSANKVFALSKFRPVGVMVYGDASFMGLPWETVLKVYRSELGRRGFGSLREYADDLIAFLPRFPVPLPEEAERAHVKETAYLYFNDLMLQILEKCFAAGRRGPTDRGLQLGRLASLTIREHHKEWEKADFLPSLPSGFLEQLLGKYRSVIDEALEDVLRVIPFRIPLSATSRDRLRTIGAYLFCKNQFLPDAGSGLVLAGLARKRLSHL